MQDDFMHGLFILAAQRLSGQRTPRALVHLMKGRKNNQVLSDASLFQLSLLYGFLSAWDNKEIENVVGELFELHWITQQQEGSKAILLCTDEAKGQLAAWEQIYRYSACMQAVSTVQTRERTVRFWKRLELLVQTLSNLTQQQHRFLPVIEERNVQHEVRRILKQYGTQELARQLKLELAEWMGHLSEWEQKIVLLRLSGKQKAGQTYNQIGELLAKPEGFVLMHQLRMGAERIRTMDSVQTEGFSVLRLLDDCAEETALSESARHTKNLLDEGLSLMEIQKRRSLKRGTIEDHLVEIALSSPLFDITRFVERDKIDFIHAIMHSHQTRRLGEIKRIAGESCTYLDIRLACTRSRMEA
ncbi:helix-turn-helix domain-containing protein [Aneurinibacillus sp. Ricciae_BoGa-3]|uniref:helix-turn-helix domain-containing protein n=1 Tax=Aneurinibacillus sp. Ricciae_BoGa-3 TaxID=3022697 RepID=UPI00233F8E5F|nr:helix-turn-helix domain-containing protein [Aneurinibacillus sp. Ricciae_BoGa-3]WCK56038.1 helix-turn-helix domain-containing protein [Aneurinibacillus sp. Ricciae_BoGa-3]